MQHVEVTLLQNVLKIFHIRHIFPVLGPELCKGVPIQRGILTFSNVSHSSGRCIIILIPASGV